METSSGHLSRQYEVESGWESASQPLPKKIETGTCKEGNERNSCDFLLLYNIETEDSVYINTAL